MLLTRRGGGVESPLAKSIQLCYLKEQDEKIHYTTIFIAHCMFDIFVVYLIYPWSGSI